MKSKALLTCWCFLVSQAVASPIVIHDSAYGTSSRTSNVIANASYIDSQPFDGITINIPATWGLLAPGSVWTYNDIYPSWLKPLIGVLKKCIHNYPKVVARPQADPFDDCTQLIANWVALATAARDSGMEGIWFDNEEYYEKMWDYPESCKYGSTKTLAQYKAQYVWLGQQVMQAIMNVWPTCKIVHTHGPYESDPNTPQSVDNGAFGGGASNHLAGYFFVGMYSVAPGQVIDGGEAYLYRQQTDYTNSYNWRKNQMEYDNSGLVPNSLQSVWQNKGSISFANYDQTYHGVTMDTSIWQSCITWGLQRCDYIVWTYSESQDYLAPGGAGADWITAIWNARHSAGIPDPGASRTPTPTPTPTPTSQEPVITNIQVSDITANSSVVSWNVNPGSTGQVEYAENSAFTSFVQWATKETNYLTFHQQMLYPRSQKEIYYRIFCTDQAGVTTVSSTGTFRTP